MAQASIQFFRGIDEPVVPDIRLTLVSQCGHWVMVEHRELFNRQTLDFLQNG